VILRPVDPLAVDFPFARTIIAIQSRRTVKRTGRSSFETRYYLSSQEIAERSPRRWIDLIRSHWAGVENRNHWRRDALWREDSTRSSNPRLLANLALIRSGLFRLLHNHHPDQSHPELRETFAVKSSLSLFRS
jgi:predicted transposase YbfD/YdcC